MTRWFLISFLTLAPAAWADTLAARAASLLDAAQDALPCIDHIANLAANEGLAKTADEAESDYRFAAFADGEMVLEVHSEATPMGLQVSALIRAPATQPGFLDAAATALAERWQIGPPVAIQNLADRQGFHWRLTRPNGPTLVSFSRQDGAGDATLMASLAPVAPGVELPC